MKLSKADEMLINAMTAEETKKPWRWGLMLMQLTTILVRQP